MQLRRKNQLESMQKLDHILIEKGELYQYQLDLLKKFQSSPRATFSFGRQMGKTTLQYEAVKTYYEIMNTPTYTKTVYLTNGAYVFEIFKYLLQKFKLTKVKGKWMATNIWYILKFLDRKGVDKKSIAEIERNIFEVLT